MIWARQAAGWVLLLDLPVLQGGPDDEHKSLVLQICCKGFLALLVLFSENGSTSVNRNDAHRKLVPMCSPAGLVGSTLSLGVENFW